MPVARSLQAGVPKDTVGLYATAWLMFRSLFIVIYTIQFHDLVAACRSLSWVMSLCITTKLMYLAAAASV